MIFNYLVISLQQCAGRHGIYSLLIIDSRLPTSRQPALVQVWIPCRHNTSPMLDTPVSVVSMNVQLQRIAVVVAASTAVARATDVARRASADKSAVRNTG